MSQFHWDFMVFLSLAAAVTGVVWALETWRFAPARRASGGPEKANGAVEFCRSFFPVIVVVLVSDVPMPDVDESSPPTIHQMPRPPSTNANTAATAASGVDYISVGALTHSAPILDLALDM